MSGTFPPPLPLADQLKELHAAIRGELPGVARIALAIYDAKTDMLQTYVSSDVLESPLSNYQKRLSEVPSLLRLVEQRRDRVIDDLSAPDGSENLHTKVINSRFGSSYTRALIDGNRLRGFVFFDAIETRYFQPAVVARLSIYAELMAVLLTRSLMPAKMLTSALEVAGEISHSRDPETGAHLDRMSHFTLAIARELAPSHELSDADLQHLLVLSPLHDVGKVGIPDSILLKAGPLSDDEFQVMKTHTTKGAELLDRLVERLSLGTLPQATMLHNIVLSHHECWDGSGYPAGLRATEIPLEARIVSVADVFDALTSERPYKKAWSWERACAFLDDNAGLRFDPEVVAAFHRAADEIRSIRQRFQDGADSFHFYQG